MTQLEFENKWHYKVIRPTGHYNIPDKEYYVTACLLEFIPNSYIVISAKFAIMALDYSLENKHWFTFDLSLEQIQDLDQRFKILGDYNNIDEEILFTLEEVDENGDYVSHFRNFTKDFEGKSLFQKKSVSEYNLGDKIFYIEWTSTTGKKMNQAFHIQASCFQSTTIQDIYDKFKDVRNWVRGGLYHFPTTLK